MKLNVSGIEVIELTDPKGLCNQPQGGNTAPPMPLGQPAIPSSPNSWQPISPVFPHTPYTGDPLPHTSIWSKTRPRAVTPKYEVTEKWGLGIPEAQTVEPQKWEKNWQSKMSQSSEGQNEVEG